MSDESDNKASQNAEGNYIAQARDGATATVIVTQEAPKPPPLYLNLPSKPNLFIGRDVILENIVKELTSDKTTALSSDGKPGIGKTTLAMAIAHHEVIKNHFTDGILWFSLGPTPELENEQAIWARAVDVDLSTYFKAEDKKQALQQKIADKKLLFIIDDVWHSDHAELFHFGSPNCTYFLTTRNQDIARGFATPQYVRSLVELTNDDAYILLSKLAPEVCLSYPVESRALSDKLGGLPLAIELIGVYLSGTTIRSFKSTQEKGLITVSNPRERLELATKRLGDITNKEQTLNQIINLSLEALDKTSREAFYSLGAFAPKPDSFSLEAAKAVTETDEEPLSNLLNSNLLDKDKSIETLSIHQVLADVTRQHTSKAAYQRHAEYYLDQANRDRHDWKNIENFYSQVRHAAEQSDSYDTWEFYSFAVALSDYHMRRGLNQTELDWWNHALELCRRTNNTIYAGTILKHIGDALLRLGNREQGMDVLKRALQEFRKAKDFVYTEYPDLDEVLVAFDEDISSTLVSIGGVFHILATESTDLKEMYCEQGLECLNEALKTARTPITKGTVFGNAGLLYFILGDMNNALDYYYQALPFRKQASDLIGEAATLNNIGQVYIEIQEYTLAMGVLKQAVKINRSIGYLEGEGLSLNHIALVLKWRMKLRWSLKVLERVEDLFRRSNSRYLDDTLKVRSFVENLSRDDSVNSHN